PIKSIAHSLRRIVDRANGLPRNDEVQQGLSLIEEGSRALGGCLRAYAQLARLPKPKPKIINVPELVVRVVDLEKRLPVTIQPAAALKLHADQDQIEPLLHNVIRTAAAASLETGRPVSIGWKQAGDWFELAIDDEGKGLPDTSNLVVPFFTTK